MQCSMFIFRYGRNIQLQNFDLLLYLKYNSVYAIQCCYSPVNHRFPGDGLWNFFRCCSSCKAETMQWVFRKYNTIFMLVCITNAHTMTFRRSIDIMLVVLHTRLLYIAKVHFKRKSLHFRYKFRQIIIFHSLSKTCRWVFITSSHQCINSFRHNHD